MRSTLVLSMLLSLSATVAVAQEAPVTPPAEAPAEAQTATAYVQEIAARVIGIVNTSVVEGTPEAEARLAALRETVATGIDFDLLSQRTLGSHWDARTPEEQATFTGLLRDMVETSYSRNLGSAGVSESDYDVSYTDERSRGARTTVEGQLVFDGETHFIEIKLEQRETNWFIYDIITDDVSLEESYAESFDRIITDDGWEGLLTRMRERLAELQAG